MGPHFCCAEAIGIVLRFSVGRKMGSSREFGLFVTRCGNWLCSAKISKKIEDNCMINYDIRAGQPARIVIRRDNRYRRDVTSCNGL